MKRRFLDVKDKAGSRRLSFIDWGAADNPRVALCVHGMTRNARDFDALAEAMAADTRVICVDVSGRGESDRLADPARYQVPTYAKDLVHLLDAEKIDAVDWVGTSMGGLIGMHVAADDATAARVRRLVLNDIGPFIPKAALARIGDYVGREWRFADLSVAEAHFREAYAPFGPLTPDQWTRLTVTSVRYQADGSFVPAYDSAIGAGFAAVGPVDADLWPMWDAITCPVLALRGADSDLLLPETAAEMRKRGPCAELVEFAGVGHAPALLDADQIGVVTEWLARKL